jgi:hypothetical protein
MRKSTKHAIAQRLLGLAGFTIFIEPIWFAESTIFPPVVLFIGFVIFAFSILSASGIGPWGRYYSALVVADNETALKSLEPKHPWQQ